MTPLLSRIVIFLIELLFFSVVAGIIIVITHARAKTKFTLNTCFHYSMIFIHGLLASMVVFIFGTLLGVGTVSLWASSALGAILGVELYYLWVALLAELGSRWAKEILSKYREY